MLTRIATRILSFLHTLYGISNCDTVKRARRWLDESQIDYQFYDLRKHGVTTKLIEQWLERVHWEALLNRRGTTWRKLDANTHGAVSKDTITPLFCEHPTLIKRPVLEYDDKMAIGFSDTTYHNLLRCGRQ